MRSRRVDKDNRTSFSFLLSYVRHTVSHITGNNGPILQVFFSGLIYWAFKVPTPFAEIQGKTGPGGNAEYPEEDQKRSIVKQPVLRKNYRAQQ